MTERPTVEQWQRNGHYIETVLPPLGGHCQLTICDIYGEGDTIKDTGDFIVKAVNCYADLVAALKECVPWLESMPLPADDQHLRDMAAKTLNDVQAAIAKAEGN